MEISISGPILNKKPKAIWEISIHTLQYGRVFLWYFFFFYGAKAVLYYFVFANILNIYIKKWKLAYLNQC